MHTHTHSSTSTRHASSGTLSAVAALAKFQVWCMSLANLCPAVHAPVLSVHWSAIFQLANCAKYRRLEFNPEAHKSLFSAVYEYPRAVPLSEAPVSPSMLSPPPAQIKSVNDLHGGLVLIPAIWLVNPHIFNVFSRLIGPPGCLNLGTTHPVSVDSTRTISIVSMRVQTARASISATVPGTIEPSYWHPFSSTANI
ncbi:hypothetical protein H9L39_06556 [Fusarium oxysporum f. sp. albedinis]|nr:hypothetical protein H9L39_06556 [Fusarium oxysporum f. sp. albedinis]